MAYKELEEKFVETLKSKAVEVEMSKWPHVPSLLGVHFEILEMESLTIFLSLEGKR